MKELTDEKKLEILKFIYGERVGNILFYYFIMRWGASAIDNKFGYRSASIEVNKFLDRKLETMGRELVIKEFDRVFGINDSPVKEKFIEYTTLQYILYDNAIFTKKDFINMREEDLQYLSGIGKVLLPKIREEYKKLKKETKQNISKLSKKEK